MVRAPVPLHKDNPCEQGWPCLCKKQKCYLHSSQQVCVCMSSKDKILGHLPGQEGGKGPLQGSQSSTVKDAAEKNQNLLSLQNKSNNHLKFCSWKTGILEGIALRRNCSVQDLGLHFLVTCTDVIPCDMSHGVIPRLVQAHFQGKVPQVEWV